MATYDMKCESGKFESPVQTLPDIEEHNFDGFMVKIHEIRGDTVKLQISLRASGEQRMIENNTAILRAGEFLSVPIQVDFTKT